MTESAKTIERRVRIDLNRQCLYLLDQGSMLRKFPVATAANGPGETMGSECTPRGRHRIRLKIGAGCPVNAVFVGRRPTGEIYTPALEKRFPGRDWILTRILWLTGLQRGLNRAGNRDTLRRFIYIHACPDQMPVGRPCSHGCIRMRNRDLVELFDLVEAGTLVDIREGF